MRLFDLLYQMLLHRRLEVRREIYSGWNLHWRDFERS
jgi:hypothetical protein